MYSFTLQDSSDELTSCEGIAGLLCNKSQAAVAAYFKSKLKSKQSPLFAFALLQRQAAVVDTVAYFLSIHNGKEQ